MAIKDCPTRATIYKINSLVRWISSKEIRKDTLEESCLNSIEAACMLEKFFSTNMLTIQMHLLVHLVDEVALARIFHSRWMFFLERLMKTLKGFLCQRARLEGSMAQESLVFITEFLISSDLEMPKLWSQDVNIRVTREEPQGKGIMRKMDIRMWDKINKFFILNLQAMDKWLEAYEEAKQKRLRERAIFRRSQTMRTAPYP